MTEKLIRKDIYFDLPFLISVKDGFRDKTLDKWFEAFKKNETLPFSRYAPYTNEPSSLVLLSDCPVYIPPEETVKPYILNLKGLKITTPENEIKIPETQIEIAFFTSSESTCRSKSYGRGNW